MKILGIILTVPLIILLIVVFVNVLVQIWRGLDDDGAKMTNFDIIWACFLGVSFICSMMAIGYDIGYRSGQIDAISGKGKF